MARFTNSKDSARMKHLRHWHEQADYHRNKPFQSKWREMLLYELSGFSLSTDDFCPYPIQPLNYTEVPWDNPNFKRSKMVLFTVKDGQLWFGLGVGGNSGRLGLIGGTREEGESMETTMFRELEEEIGLEAVNNIDFLSGVYFNLGFAWSGFLYLKPHLFQPIRFERKYQEICKIGWFTPRQFFTLLHEADELGAYRSTFRVSIDLERLAKALPFLLREWKKKKRLPEEWKYQNEETPSSIIPSSLSWTTKENFLESFYSSIGREEVVVLKVEDEWLFFLRNGTSYRCSKEEEPDVRRHIHFLRSRVLSNRPLLHHFTRTPIERKEMTMEDADKFSMELFEKNGISAEENDRLDNFLFVNHLFTRVSSPYFSYDDLRNVRKIYQQKGRFLYDIYMLFNLLAINDQIMQQGRPIVIRKMDGKVVEKLCKRGYLIMKTLRGYKNFTPGQLYLCS